MSGFNNGDVVVCVDPAPRTPRQDTGLSRGRIYRVLDVGVTPKGDSAVWTGRMEADGSTRAMFVCERFRHLPKADDAFTAQMRALKPVKQQA